MTTATVNPPPKLAPQPNAATKLSAGEELIAATIAEAQRALWRAELSRLLLKLVIATLAGLIAWAIVDQWIWSPGPLVRLLVLAAGVIAGSWWVATRIVPLLRSRIRADYAAQSLEHDLPELRHALTSYVSLRGDVDINGPRGAVVRSIGSRAAGQMRQHHVDVPSEATGTLTWWIAMAATLAIAFAYSLVSPKNTLQSAQRLLLPLSNVQAPTRVEISDVLPGDCEILAERPLEVSATIEGLSRRDEPSVQFGQGFSQREPLQLDASSGRFVASVRVSRSTRYRIVAGDASAGPFEILARDVPVASVRSVQIVPPNYTALPPRQSTGGAVTAEENSQVTLTANVNRPIQRARVDFNPRTSAQRSGPSAGSVEMTVAPDGLTASATIAMRLPRQRHAAVAIDSYSVRVWDTDGNENPDPIVYPVRVIPDLSPEVSIVAPREVVKEVPINSQQLFEIGALDPDYGLRRIELRLQRGADEPSTEILWSSADSVRGNQIAEYRFRPEQLGLRVGEKVLVTAVAIDNRENLDEQPEPNRSETQPIELLIVPSQQLPPVSTPEDGLSEPDDEPANRAAPPDRDQDAGGDDQGDGQAGGAGTDGDAAEGQQSEPSGGASDAADGQRDENASPEPSGQDASGQDASGAQQGQRDQAMDPGQSDSGEPSPEDQRSQTGDSPAGGASEAADAQADDSAQPDDSAKPDGSATPDDRSPQSTAPSDAASGDQEQTSAPGETAEADSQQPTGADSDASADPSGKPGQPDAMPETADRERGPDDSQADGQPESGTPQADSADDALPSESDAPEPSEAVPPQHDGDAFERIRDYLKQQQAQPSRQPPSTDSQPPAQPESADGPSGETGQPAPDGDASTAPQDQGTADSGDNAGSDPTGSDAADSEALPRSSDDARGEDGGEPSDQGSTEDASGEADAGRDAAADDAAAPDSDAADPRGDSAPESDQSSPDDSASGQPQPADAQDSSASPRSSETDQPGDAQGQASAGDGGPVSDAGEGGEGTAEHSRPPDPVDLEHARQATDLVLDYLDQNRDTPDPELLERLNWTPEELRAFTDRWQQLLKAQETPEGGGADANQIEEALRSLGLRQGSEGPIGETRDRDDALRGLRDGGNRPPAPTLYRDAFEAFRRGVGRP